MFSFQKLESHLSLLLSPSKKRIIYETQYIMNWR